MSRYLRLVLLLLGLGSLAGMVVLFFLPTTWEVRRQRDIAAPPEAIYPHLVELRRWREWSPWQESDYPGLVYRYSGPPAGPGAAMTWDHERTGDGRLLLLEADAPRRLRFEMAFQKGRIRLDETLRLTPLPGGGTRVVWEDRGDLGRTLFGRLSLGLIEESMGRDLERGLAGLARVAEAGNRPAASV